MSGRGTIPTGAVRHPTVISSGANAVSGVEKSHHLILLAFTTPGILKDVFFLIGVSLKGWTRAAGEKVTEESALAVNEISWACLSQIQGMSIVLNLGFAEHLEASALRSKNPDYEDNLLLATAQNAKVDYIITKGKGLLANDVVSAITPAEYVEMRG